MYSKNSTPLSEAVRLLRIYSDIKQGDLSKNLGFRNNVISQIENGNREITLKTLEKYAKIFKIQVSDIMSFANQIEKNKNIKKEIFKIMLQAIKEGV